MKSEAGGAIIFDSADLLFQVFPYLLFFSVFAGACVYFYWNEYQSEFQGGGPALFLSILRRNLLGLRVQEGGTLAILVFLPQFIILSSMHVHDYCVLKEQIEQGSCKTVRGRVRGWTPADAGDSFHVGEVPFSYRNHFFSYGYRRVSGPGDFRDGSLVEITACGSSIVRLVVHKY